MEQEPAALSGTLVVEYADFVSGPYAGRMLAELGATVIKVEPPGAGDSARRTSPFAHDDPGPDSSLLFNYLNVNKLGVTLDVSTPTGREWLLRLISDAGIFLYGGPAPEMDRLGLGYRDLAAVNPLLIGVYVTPFGLTGPYRSYAGGELVATHLSGLAYDTPGGLTSAERPSLKPGGRHAMMLAGLHAGIATLYALFAREANGEGQEVDVSEIEPVTSIQFGSITRYAFARQPNPRGESQASPIYRAADGTVAINPMQDYMWRAMVEVMGNPEWADRPEFATRGGRTQNRRQLQSLVAEWTRQLPKEEVYQRMQGSRVPAFPSNTVADVLQSEHMRSRNFFEPVPLPSGETAVGPGPRYRLAEGMPGVRRAAPRLGEHNRQVYVERLGLSPEDLVTAYQTGII